MSPTVRNRTVARERLLVGEALDEVRGGVEHPVAPEHLALVREVDRRQLELLARDVLPHVELRPVRDREHADVLALADARVVEVPELGALRARVPLAEVVAEAEDALLRAGALLVAARAAHRGVEAVLLDRVEQRRRLQLVARCARARLLGHASLVDRLLDARDDEPLAELVRRGGRGTRSPRGSCGPCRRASPGTGTSPGGTPSRRDAAARSSPCRRRRAAPAAHARRRPRA